MSVRKNRLPLRRKPDDHVAAPHTRISYPIARPHTGRTMAQQKVQTDRTGRIGVKLLRMLTPVAGILVFLAIWQAGVMFSGVPAYLLPAPTEIGQTFINEFPRLLRHGWVTTYEMLLGYLLAVDRHSPGNCDYVVSTLRRIRHADDAFLSGRAQGRDCAIVPSLVWRRGIAEDPCRFPDFLFSNRHRRRGGLALDVVGDDGSGTLDGCEPHPDFHAIPIADKPALPVQRAQGGGDARHCGRGRGRIRGRRQGLGLSAAGDEFEYGDGLDVLHPRRIDVHRPGFLLLGRISRIAADSVARYPPDPRRKRHDVMPLVREEGAVPAPT